MTAPDWYDYLTRCINPTGTLDALLYGILLAGVIFLILVNWGPEFKGWLRALPVVFGVCGATLYIMIVLVVVPWSQRFSDQTTGILIPRFSGSQMEEQFGNKQFHEILETNLKHRLRWHKLDTLVAVLSVAYVPSDSEEAMALMEKYNADVILWGEVTQLDNGASVLSELRTNPIVFGAVGLGVTDYKIGLTIVKAGRYPLSFDDSTFNLESFVKKVIDGAVFPIAAQVAQLDQAAADKFIIGHPEIAEEAASYSEAPFVLGAAAGAFERAGEPEVALGILRRAFGLFENMKLEIDRLGSTPLIPDSVICRFAAFNKYHEALLALEMGDTSCALEAIAVAAAADRSLEARLDRNYRILCNNRPLRSHELATSSPFVGSE